MWGENEAGWNEAGERLKNDDGTVRLFGHNYKVIGTYRGIRLYFTLLSSHHLSQ